MSTATNAPAKSEKPTHSTAPARTRAQPQSPATAEANGLESIQQSAGNLAVQHLFRAGAIQAKLTISQPNDPDEQEADAVADRIMRMPEPSGSVPCAAEDQLCPKCSGAAKIQCKAGDAAGRMAVSENPIRHLGLGQPLDRSVRAFFEPRLGADLSRVRVHVDGRSAESASSIQARAYTVDHNIVFGAKEYSTVNQEGQKLLAHELIHVIQQDRGQIRISRLPGGEARLNQLPLSVYKTRPELLYTFQNVYAEAAGGVKDFEATIKAACAESLAPLKLTGDQRDAVNTAAVDIASVTTGMDIGGKYETFNLAQAVKRLYELLHGPDEFGIVIKVSYGFEYMFDRLSAHSADYVALYLQEYAHGTEISSDPGLASVIRNSYDSFIRLDEDMNRIVSGLQDGKSLLMLELEGLVSELVNLRNQFDPRSSSDVQQQNYLLRSELARRALLLNKKLMEMTDSPTAATPLDESVKTKLSEIHKTAKSEDDTRKALGDEKSLLAAQPLNMGERVDDPFFAQSGLSDQDEASQIKPQVAFPKTTDRFATAAQGALADRINVQSDSLKTQMNKIVPPHEQSKYNLPEFVLVHRHWFSLFGIEKEKAIMAQMHVMDLWQGIHQATAIGTLSTSGDMMTAWLRYETMKLSMDLLGLFVDTGVEKEFGSVINNQAMSRKQKLSGSGASNARYEFGEIYSNQPATLGGEEESRVNLLTQKSESTAQQFTAAAVTQNPQQVQGDPNTRTLTQGSQGGALPVLGLRTVQAKEGWSYLVEVPDYMTGQTVAYEQKTATPEVAAYLLAQRQHAATLKNTHSAVVSVPSPGNFSNATTLRTVGPTPALEGGLTSKTSSLNQADREARKAISMPGRDSSQRAPSGSDLLQSAMLDYLNAFFERADGTLRVAVIIHMMNVEHGIGKVFDKMLEPGEIAKVLAKAFGIGFGLGVLSSFGPIGKILSQGIGQAMKVAGGSDLTAALTVAGFLKEASEVKDFGSARIMGYLGVPIVEDIKQLFESVISAPAAMTGSKAADVGVKAVLDRINQKPPATVAEAADLARQLANVSPEAQREMMAATQTYIAEMESQGAGKFESNRDYEMMIAFRNAYKQQSTMDQTLDAFTTKLDVNKPAEAKTPFEGPTFRLQSAGERAKLLDAMGDLAGKVQLFQDPTLRGENAATVRVYYGNGKVRIHHGSEATAHDIALHMPTVRTLRKYEGVGGSIRILAERVGRLLGFTSTPEYGTKGREAEIEIAKLTAIRDDLVAQQNAIDLYARRLTDADTSHPIDSKEIDSAIIDKHIADVDRQILEHMRNLDSIEAGVGFIEARRKSPGAVRAETLGLDKATPAGHYWRESDGRLELVKQDPKAEGFFVNQEILATEIAKGKPGDPKLAIRPIAENVSAGTLKARTFGLGDAPKGHYWRADGAGNLQLVRSDEKAAHFWFDQDSYVQAAKTDAKADPKKFIRPIAEKANSDSESARFDAKTWDEAYAELGGDDTSTSFGKFRKVLGDLRVDKVAIIEQMKKTEGGDSRGESPSGLGIRTIRHSTKQYYVDAVIMKHLTDPTSLADSPRYQALIEKGVPARDAEMAASHERLLAITRQLDSADIGSLGEKWNAHWSAQKRDFTQFGVSKADIAGRYKDTDIGQDRNIDLLHLVGDEKADLIEVKNVASPVGEREKGEMDAHIALFGKDVPMPGGGARTIQKVVWVILNPDFLTSNTNVVFMTERLKKNSFLEFRVYDENGNMVTVNSGNYTTMLAGLVSAAQKAKAAR